MTVEIINKSRIEKESHEIQKSSGTLYRATRLRDFGDITLLSFVANKSN